VGDHSPLVETTSVSPDPGLVWGEQGFWIQAETRMEFVVANPEFTPPHSNAVVQKRTATKLPIGPVENRTKSFEHNAPF
jgi:hypothetical protein